MGATISTEDMLAKAEKDASTAFSKSIEKVENVLKKSQTTLMNQTTQQKDALSQQIKRLKNDLKEANKSKERGEILTNQISHIGDVLNKLPKGLMIRQQSKRRQRKRKSKSKRHKKRKSRSRKKSKKRKRRRRKSRR